MIEEEEENSNVEESGLEKKATIFINSTIGDKEYKFKREEEVIIARFLEWQKENKKILNWEYRPTPYVFQGKGINVSNQYQPSFKVEVSERKYKLVDVRREWTSEHMDRIKRFLKFYPEWKTRMQIIDRTYFEENEIKLKKGGFWL